MNQRRRDDLALELFRNVPALDAVAVRLGRHAIGLALVVAVLAAAYAANVADGLRAAATTTGRLEDPGLSGPVVIARDLRDVPHISASSDRDAYFAEGFVEGSDRLFQMELTRRYALGTLAEVLGPRALALDRAQRYYDVRDIAHRQWKRLPARERAALQAFSAGVNAAMRTQSLPVEFRLLLYRPAPWKPEDSLAVSLAVSIALADSWRDVLSRDEIWRRAGPQRFDAYFPLTDSRYDVSLRGINSVEGRSTVAAAPLDFIRGDRMRPRAGSNAWAAGAERTASGRALLANDPHLDLTIPGLWYLLDVRAPGLHVAGASIPGAPGVLLGHNERVAWGATNADVATMSLFRPGRLDRRAWRREIFHVRFGRDAAASYYRTARAFGVEDDSRHSLVLVRWPQYYQDDSAVATFLALDRARSTREALGVLSRYAGTAENFVVADVRGDVAYHLAGSIANDPAWGRYVHPARELNRRYPALAFAALPAIAPARDGVLVSANNKMYGAGYPYRLSATFDPPYRAYRIAELLRARSRYDAAYFARMQLDTVSPVDLEFARDVSAYARSDWEPMLRGTARQLDAWNGSFARGSRAATVVHALRANLEENAPSLYAVLRRFRDGAPGANEEADLRGMLYYAGGLKQPWGRAGSVAIEHPLAPLRFGFLNGATLPGDGDEYTIHLQESGFSQSFRAVWDVGAWDAGGIVIPSGESGEPGSGHYTDLTQAWTSGQLEPLPFSARAVRAATRATLVLEPQP